MNMIAKNLIALRHAFGYTQNDIADKVFVSRQAVSKWERGESCPDIDTLVALSTLYSVSVDALLKEDLTTVEIAKTDEIVNFDDLKAKHKKALAIKMTLVAISLFGAYALLIGIIFCAAANVEYLWLIWFSLPILPPILFVILFRHDINRRIMPFFVNVPFISGIIYLVVSFFGNYDAAWMGFLLIPFYYLFAIVFFIVCLKQDRAKSTK